MMLVMNTKMRRGRRGSKVRDMKTMDAYCRLTHLSALHLVMVEQNTWVTFILNTLVTCNYLSHFGKSIKVKKKNINYRREK